MKLVLKKLRLIMRYNGKMGTIRTVHSTIIISIYKNTFIC